MQVVNVEVQDVEIIRTLPHLVEHQHVMRNRVADMRIKAQGPGRARNEFRGGDGIPTREQGDLMTLPNQLLG